MISRNSISIRLEDAPKILSEVLFASSTSNYLDFGLARFGALPTVVASKILGGHEFEETTCRVSSTVRFMGRHSREV